MILTPSGIDCSWEDFPDTQMSFELIVMKVVQLYGNSGGVNSDEESRLSHAA